MLSLKKCRIIFNAAAGGGMKVNMGVKQHVLEALEKNKGKTVSGSKLAEELSISRNAVWKAIEALREEGYRITAVTNQGYCLSRENDILSNESIKPYLRGNAKDLRIEVRSVVTSTNTILKELAGQGEAEGKVMIAEEQTKGKGRLGRSFYSPPKTGVYVSILLRPKMTIEDSLFITTAAAVAVAKAIEAVTGVETGIKWVNDVFSKGKKVCGILTEAGIDFEGGGLDYAIVGIGVNVTRPEKDFPKELEHIATAVVEDTNYSSQMRSQIAAEILNNFWKFYEDIENKPFLKEYRERSIVIGKEINIISGDSPEPALALDIDDRARLIVKLTSGEIKNLSSGEVSIRLKETD